MPKEDAILKKIMKLGDVYCSKHLSVDAMKLETNWWSALEFFFNRSFMRGRRDALSDEYCRFTIEVLKDYFSVDDLMNSENLEKAYRRLKQKEQLFDKQIILDFKKENHIGKSNSVNKQYLQDFHSKVAVENELIDKLVTLREIKKKPGDQGGTKPVRLGNDEDIMMVLDVLRFIADDNKGNIYKYIKDTIVNKGVKEAYRKLKTLRAISDKLASFVIRDIGLLNPEIIGTFDYEYAFPVDIWVVRVSKELGCEKEDPQDIKQFFIEKCNNFDISPLKVAAGLWFLGAKSFEVAIDYYILDKEVPLDVEGQSSQIRG